MRSVLAGMLLASVLAFGSSAALAQSDETASLRVQGFGGDAQLKAIENAVARFNEDYPNVSVEISMDPISSGWGDYVTKVLGQFNAGQPADIYGTAIETFQSFSSRGLWIPLNDYVEANSEFSDFAPSLFEQASYNGEIHYIPIGWNNIMINYNRDHFDAAGIEYPARDWTWEDFRATAKALTIRDGSGNVTQFGYEVPNQFFFVQPWFFSNGTSILNEDWTGSNMLDPKVAESLQFLYDLIHVDGVSPIPGNETLDNQFNAGQVSMISRGHWIIQNAIAANLNMDVAVPPRKETQDTVIGFGGYAISKQSQHPDLAKALITHLTSFETQAEEGEGGGGVPGRKSAAETEGFLAFPPSAALYYETLPETRSVPSPANFQEVESIFIRQYQAMMSGEVSIEDGVQQAHEELEASFERLRQQLGQN